MSSTGRDALRLGVDLGGSKIEAVLLDARNRAVAVQRRPTPRSSYGDVLAAISDLCDSIEAPFAPGKSLALGIGTPGSPSPATGLMRNSNSTLLNSRALLQDLRQRCARRVRMANDADCFALSETSDGAGAGSRVVFGVILGTGVGAGVCIDGRLLRGHNAIAGEWGHNRLPLERITRLPERLLPSRACYCGRSDCIETWLSGAGLALTHEQLHAETIDENDLKGAQAGGALRETLDTYREMLAAALATVVNLLDPGVIVLGGGLSNNQTLYAELPELLADQVFSDYFATRIRPAQHGDSSGVRGAAWLWP